MAAQLLASEKTAASLGAEDRLKQPSWAARQAPGTGGVLFWGVLALVIVALLTIIARLLPKPSDPVK